MAKSLIPFDSHADMMPAQLADVLGGPQNSELQGGVSGGYPVISFRGKTWSVVENGVANIVRKPDDPDEIASTLEVVIVKANAALSKVYYSGGYVEGSNEKPACYSNDGLKPAADAQTPQCGTCAACPQNMWGSRISDNGTKGKACSDSRRIAVVPSGELDRPMLLRVPAATLKDLSQYAEQLTKRNAPYQAVVTKIGFDPTVAHPKFTFRAVRWVNPDEAASIRTTMQSDVVSQIIGTKASPAAQDESVAALGPPPASTPAAKPSLAPMVPPKPVTRAPVNPPAMPAAEAAQPPAGKTTRAPRHPGFQTAKVPAKAPVPESKATAAAHVIDASDELDKALSELDDL